MDFLSNLLRGGRDDEIARLNRRVAGLEATVRELCRQAGIDPRTLPQPAGTDPEVLGLLGQGKKIAAIKRYREVTGTGLKEAKDAVDALEARGHFDA